MFSQHPRQKSSCGQARSLANSDSSSGPITLLQCNGPAQQEARYCCLPPSIVPDVGEFHDITKPKQIIAASTSLIPAQSVWSFRSTNLYFSNTTHLPYQRRDAAAHCPFSFDCLQPYRQKKNETRHEICRRSAPVLSIFPPSQHQNGGAGLKLTAL